MPNKTFANEWITTAGNHLKAAKLLFGHHHSNDIIGIELHQSVEKALKAIPAYNNLQIEKTHDLAKLL